MTFYSVSFLVFFVIFSILINIAPSTKVQHYVFLAANIVFYSFWDYRFIVLLLAVIVMCYYSAILYEKKKLKLYIYIPVIVCLIVLGVFKYFNFFTESFSKIFGIKDYVTLNLILPLGISFYLFQAMSYLFDVKNSKVQLEKDFIKFSSYISFFPQITSGPIVKSKDFLPQLDVLHRVRKDNVYMGIQLFLIGLTKKIVFADRIGVAVDAVYSAPRAYNGISIIFAIIGYSIQIYCDFSGYSNMAIGIAKIWDFDLGENFNAPYIARNPSDFWRRWHISLSTWFRDYVYIPLGGSRKGKIRTYFNLFITMVLSGIWHGANSTFIVWGIIHGIGSAVNKIFNDLVGKEKKVIVPEGLCITINFIFVSLAWVVFRAENVKKALSIIYGIFNTDGIMYVSIFVIVYAVFFLIVDIYILKKNNSQVITTNINLDKFSGKLIVAVWIWLIVMFMYVGNSAFIYAQF